MTQLLQQAFERAAALPQEDQNRLGRLLLAEMESHERRSEHIDRLESKGEGKQLANDLLTRPPSKSLAELYGVFADGKSARSKSEERKIAREARSVRYG